MAELKMNIQMCVNPCPGRTLMLQFECGRCGKKHTEPFQSYKAPEGWRECEKSTPLLCPECHKAFDEFMNGCFVSFDEKKLAKAVKRIGDPDG